MRYILAFTSIIALAGCASINKQPLSSQTADSIRGHTVAQVTRKAPDFAAITPGKAAFALIGAVAMIAEGNKIIETYKIDDPANSIGLELSDKLARKLGTQMSSDRVTVSQSEPAQIASAARPIAKLALDVQTTNWSFVYFPTNWSRYRVIYSAKATLIQTETGKVIAEGFCKRIPETDVGASTYDELLASDAKLLKEELRLAGEECVRTLGEEMFSLQ